MKYFFCNLLLISNIIFAQEATKNSFDSLCVFQTDGTGKSNGLKIKISVPCIWKSGVSESQPNAAGHFAYQFDKSSAMLTLSISNLSTVYSKSEIDNQFSEPELRKLGMGLCETKGPLSTGKGVLISCKKVMIDSNVGGEIIFKRTDNYPSGLFNYFCIQYYIIYKGKLIIIGYAVRMQDKTLPKPLIEKFEKLFQNLSQKTKIIY